MVDLDTRLLRAFVTVAEELNFTRAAERLHLAQQALSAQIRQCDSTFSPARRTMRVFPGGRIAGIEGARGDQSTDKRCMVCLT